MSGVKPAIFGILMGAAALTASGCSETQLSRFAPPGIVKYEDIASEKPPNPAIDAKIKERSANSNAVYPVISQTPGQSDRPEKPAPDFVEAEISELVAVRDAMNAQIEADRAAAAADQAALEQLAADKDDFQSRLQSDNEAAKAERRDPIASPDE